MKQVRLIFVFLFLALAAGTAACGAAEVPETAATATTTVAEKIGDAIEEVEDLQTAVAATAPPATSTPLPTETPSPANSVAPPEGLIALEGAPMPPVAPLKYEWWGGVEYTPFYSPKEKTVVFYEDATGAKGFYIWAEAWGYSVTYHTYDVWRFPRETNMDELNAWAISYLNFIQIERPDGWQFLPDEALEEGGGAGGPNDQILGDHTPTP